jgi:hypothetical protein
MSGDNFYLFPSSPRRGGRDLNKNVAKPPYGADGVVIKFRQKFVLEFTHHPVGAS